MREHFDPEKNQRNIQARGLSFESAIDFMFFASPRLPTAYVSSASARPTPARLPAMPSSKRLIDPQGKVREIRSADLQSFRPATQALPAGLQRKLGVRGPQKSPTKERITIRLSPHVVARFRATGEGWQSRVDAALQDWLKTNKPAKTAR